MKVFRIEVAVESFLVDVARHSIEENRASVCAKSAARRSLNTFVLPEVLDALPAASSGICERELLAAIITEKALIFSVTLDPAGAGGPSKFTMIHVKPNWQRWDMMVRSLIFVVAHSKVAPPRTRCDGESGSY